MYINFLQYSIAEPERVPEIVPGNKPNIVNKIFTTVFKQLNF